MGLSHSPRMVTNGLVLCLDAGNTRSYSGSGTTWTDLSNNLNLTGSASFLTTQGLNSGSAWSSSSTSLLNNDIHTLSFMMNIKSNVTYPSGSSGSWDKIFSFNAGGSDRSPSIWRWPSNRVLHWRYDPSNTGANIYTNGVESGTEFSLDTWYLITGTKNGATFNSYVNGSLIGTSTVSATKTAGSAPIILFEGYLASCTLQCVTLYNRALSEAEIRQNFNALRGRFGI